MSHKPTARTDHERPETYPVYQAVRKVRLDDSRESVLVGIKPTGMDTHFPDEQILHHDLAGRLLRIAQPNVQWRRGLSGRMIELRRRTQGAWRRSGPSRAERRGDRSMGRRGGGPHAARGRCAAWERTGASTGFSRGTWVHCSDVRAAGCGSPLRCLCGTRRCGAVSGDLPRHSDSPARSVLVARLGGHRRMPIQPVHVLRLLP